MKKRVVAIGEILWDIFPAGKKAGGSSMNVALNLHKQNIDSKLISAIGDDELGTGLISFLHNKQFPTKLIQQNSLPTSTVQVKLDLHQQASYTINEPVAWDNLELTEQSVYEVKNADAFVYCSLTCRNEKSKSTILALLQYAKLKIFDINLREPFYTIETLEVLLKEADVLKVNEHELAYLKNNFMLIGHTDEELLHQLSEKYNISIICLTLGENGAYVFQENKLYHQIGYRVSAVDTVGAGDAFLATFIASYLQGLSMNEVLDKSCKVGAYVATQEGANPDYGAEIFVNMTPGLKY